MDFEPLMNAPLLVQSHVFCAITALVLVPVMLVRRKGDWLHKIIGRIWVLAMALTALTSFGIMDIRLVGPFSPIHGLSLLTLYSLISAVYHARAGRIEAHKQSMFGAMVGLVGAGIFTVLPVRLMSQTLFPDLQTLGFLGVVVLGTTGLILWRAKLRGSSFASAR